MENLGMDKKKYVLFGLITLLIIGNIYFIFKSGSLSAKLSETQAEMTKSSRNEKVVAFMGLFVDKVLKSEKDIDFDTRLALENSVRATGDQELVNQWQKFTNAKTEKEAQVEVKNLLGMIAEKIR